MVMLYRGTLPRRVVVVGWCLFAGFGSKSKLLTNHSFALCFSLPQRLFTYLVFGGATACQKGIHCPSRLASRRCRFTIMDAPGHSDFSKDMVTAMSQDTAAFALQGLEKNTVDQEEKIEKKTQGPWFFLRVVSCFLQGD